MALPALLFALFAGQEAVAAGLPEPTPAEAQAAAANAVQAEYTPEGAPRDDYNFVAWCHGVLSGHMALAERIQPVLPLDDAQQKIGRSYLKGYEEALAVGRRGRSPAELDAADAVRAAARANWNTAMKADLQLGADTYLAWQLPGRCEHAAKRVAGRADLFRMVPQPQDDETVGTGAALSDAPMPDAPVAARPAAPAAPAVAAAPVSTTPVVTPTAAAAPASDVPVFTSADLAAETPAPAEAPSTDVFTTAVVDEGSSEAPAESPAEVAAPAPVEAETTAAAETAPAEAAAAETPQPEAKPADRRIVRMPQKGRLFPWGKRE